MEDNSTVPVNDKYSGEVIAPVPVASQAIVGRAVAGAHAAFASYSRVPAYMRSRTLAKTSQLLGKYQEDLATLICREAGKAWKYSL
jgi:acyl-CoA reductase-like NAD-dependent aldehyde dehydrogenase